MILKSYLEFAYINCIHYLIRKTLHWSEKLFWFICILLSMAGAYYVIQNTITSYNEQTVSLTVDTSYLDWKTPFPSIVFCPAGSHNIKNRLLTILDASEIHTNLIDQIKFLAFYQGQYNVDFCDRGECIKDNFSYYTNIVRDNCSEIFTSCLYNNRPFPCCTRLQIVKSYLGECFAVNNLEAENSRGLELYMRRGPNMGYGNLSIELHNPFMIVLAMSPDAVPSKPNINQQLLDSFTQVIQEKSVYTSFVQVTEVISSPSAINLNIKERLCRLPHENFLDRFTNYSLSACQNECLIKAHLAICNCTVHLYPNILREEECDWDGILCLSKNARFVEQKLIQCRCEMSCRTMNVKEIGFVSNRISRFRHEATKARVDVYVPAPIMRMERTAVRTFNDLIVAVGGTLGLFLGVSVISFVQIFIYLVIRPITDSYRRRDRKKMHEKNRKIDESLAKHSKFVPHPISRK